MRPLTSDDRKCALVFDDTPYFRNRSKKVELLSICKDHTGNKPKNYKGFYMLEEIKGTPSQAKYVLFDSWFSSPSALLDIEKLGYRVVSRLKNNNTQYICQGQGMTLSKIYSNNRKRRDRSNTKKWIALISTDVSLTEEEIIELYGKSICELFFVMCKELDDISFQFAFELIQSCMIKSAQETLELDDAQLEVFLTHFLACLPAYIQVKLRVGNSES